MYIREDADKLRRRRVITGVWTAVMLVTMLVCLYRIDTVCKMQMDTLDQVMELRQKVDELAEVDHVGDVNNMISLGEFKITHYCSCAKCCGKTDGITYTGAMAAAGRTISVDPDVIPLGSRVTIDGHEYVAEDIGGGIRGHEIDMFVDDHQEALELGVKYMEVWLCGRN